MTTFVDKFLEAYHNADPRTKDYFLARTPIPMILIVSSYLYFCLKCGPRFMKTREPYDLKSVLIVYNIVQIFVSLYLSYYGTKVLLTYNWFCAPLEYSEDPISLLALHLSHVYLWAKISELLDTVFFVLRKKFNQMTFLHVFHHSFMVAIPCIALRYIAGGHGIVFGLFNSMVHAVMYTYYLIANLGPEYRKYLWWKKYLTIMQLVQFLIIFVHSFVPLFTSCSYPKSANLMYCMTALFFIYMFSDFYYKTYIRPKKGEEKKKIK